MNENISSMLRRIDVLTHSSVRIETAKGKVIYIDPYEMDGIRADADIVFFTHSHYDHYSTDDADLVMKGTTLMVYPEDMDEQIVEDYDIPEEDRCRVTPGQSCNFRGWSFDTVAAYNIKAAFHPKKNHWVGYILKIDGLRIYIAGDTDATAEAKNVRCDIALLPVGGKFTMDAEEAAELTRAITPQVVIPTHYGTVAGTPEDGERFKDLVGEDCDVVLKM